MKHCPKRPKIEAKDCFNITFEIIKTQYVKDENGKFNIPIKLMNMKKEAKEVKQESETSGKNN